jgi:hypothetical protein
LIGDSVIGDSIWRLRDSCRFTNGVGVNGDDRVDIRGVATRHRDDDRDVARLALREHERVAAAQTVDGEFQPAETIAFVRIGAGHVEHEAGLVSIEHGG